MDFNDNANGENSFSSDDDIWNSDAALESIKMEKSLAPDETNAEMTARLLEEASPAAAQSIIHIALHSGNDNTRLSAARYITDWVKESNSAGMQEKWENLVGEVVDQAELYANSEQS